MLTKRKQWKNICTTDSVLNLQQILSKHKGVYHHLWWKTSLLHWFNKKIGFWKIFEGKKSTLSFYLKKFKKNFLTASATYCVTHNCVFVVEMPPWLHFELPRDAIKASENFQTVNKTRSGSLFHWKIFENFLTQKWLVKKHRLYAKTIDEIVCFRTFSPQHKYFEKQIQNIKVNSVVTFCRHET